MKICQISRFVSFFGGKLILHRKVSIFETNLDEKGSEFRRELTKFQAKSEGSFDFTMNDSEVRVKSSV